MWVCIWVSSPTYKTGDREPLNYLDASCTHDRKNGFVYLNVLNRSESKEIAAPEVSSVSLHLIDRHSTHCRSGNERPDAGACVNRRLYPELGESTQDADVRKALESAATKHKRNLPLSYARLGFAFCCRGKRVRQVQSMLERYNCIDSSASASYE